MTFDPDLRAYNAQAIPTCKVADLPADPSSYVLEPKYDGFRLIAHVKPDGVDTWTRSMKSQNGRIPYVDAELRKLFPPGTVVDGEICALQVFEDPDTGLTRVVNDFEWVQSVMLSKPERAVAQAKAGRPLSYVIFDIMYVAGQDVRTSPFDARRTMLEHYICDSAAQAFLEHTSLTVQFDATQDVHDRHCAMGFEGTIAKHRWMPYRSGERGAKKKDAGLGQYKLKTQDSVDAVLINIKPGTPGSEFDGMVGSLIFGQPVKPGEAKMGKYGSIYLNGVQYVARGACSGITLTERRRLTKIWKDDPDSLWGRPMSFKHMGKYPDGVTFRHPQFDRWRPDKPLKDIVWDG